MKNKTLKKFDGGGGANKVHYDMGDVQVAYSKV